MALLTDNGALTADRLCFVGGALRSGIVPVVLHAALTLPNAPTSLPTPSRRSSWTTCCSPRSCDDGGATAELATVPLARPMLYTSGTTGVPKGVWTGVLDEAEATSLAADEQELWGFVADDRHLVCGNAHHSAPLRFSLGTLLAGGSVILPGKFDAPNDARRDHPVRTDVGFMAPVHLAPHRSTSAATTRPLSRASDWWPTPVRRAPKR